MLIKFVRYILQAGISRIAQTLLLAMLIEWFGLHYLPASILAGIIVHIGNFPGHLKNFRSRSASEPDTKNTPGAHLRNRSAWYLE